MLVSSTNSRISGPACDQNTPSPHAISGRSAATSISSARSTLAGSAAERTSSIVNSRAPLRCPASSPRVIENVLRNLEQRDALRRRDSLAEGGAQVELNRRPVGHALGELREAGDDFGAVGFLKRAEMILGVGMLSRDADDGAVGESRDAQSRHRVGEAASGGDHAYADFARGARVGVGRVGGGLLVTHVDQLDVVIAQLAEDRKQMPAVDRETILDTILAHHARDQFSAVSFRHY